MMPWSSMKIARAKGHTLALKYACFGFPFEVLDVELDIARALKDLRGDPWKLRGVCLDALIQRYKHYLEHHKEMAA